MSGPDSDVVKRKSDEIKDRLTELCKEKAAIELAAEREHAEKQRLADKQAAAAERYMKDGTVPGEKGERIDIFEDLRAHAQHDIEATRESFKNWEALALEMLIAARRLRKALSYGFTEIAVMLASPIEEKGITYFEKIKDRFSNKEITLPDLYFAVDFNAKDNRVEIAELQMGVGAETDDQLNSHFKKGLDMFFANEGYAWDRTQNTYVKPDPKDNKSSIAITKKEFEDIKNNPDKGLLNFLNGTYESNFVERPTVSP